MLEALERLSLSMAAFSGLVADSVVRGPGWRFLEVGRRVERALLVLGLVESMLIEAPADAEQPLYETLLAGCESLVAYRRRHRSHVVLATVANNLLADPDNPRAVAFQIDALHTVLARLPDRSAVAGLRRLVADARRSCSVPATTPQEVLQRVLTVRSEVLAVADAVPQVWFRTGEGRGRRVRAVNR